MIIQSWLVASDRCKYTNQHYMAVGADFGGNISAWIWLAVRFRRTTILLKLQMMYWHNKYECNKKITWSANIEESWGSIVDNFIRSRFLARQKVACCGIRQKGQQIVFDVACENRQLLPAAPWPHCLSRVAITPPDNLKLSDGERLDGLPVYRT